MPEEGINQAEFPDILYDLWHWFLRLNASRGGGMGPGPITEQDIGWFFRNRRIEPQGWQLDAIRMLDGIALGSMAE